MTQYLFVYGTLRQAANHPMFRVLAQYSSFAGEGTVTARLYDLGNYPGIVLSSDPNERVAGEVYLLTASTATEALRLLDDYEGIAPGKAEPYEYRRVPVDVFLSDSTTVTAWAYVLADPAPSHPRIPASDYLEWKKARAEV